MANDVHFKMTMDGNQVITVQNNVLKNFDNVNKAIKQTNKNLSQMGSDDVNPYKHITDSDTVNRADNSLNEFGRTIKSLRIHGIDPITNSIARFINVLGGGMFNTVTAMVTAVMALFYAIRKVNSLIQDYYGALSSRANTLLKISKQRVKDTEDERKQIDKVINQLKQMNKKQKLSNVEKNIALSLVQQIKNKWSDVGIQIDKNTGKIKNFNEVEARLNREQKFTTYEELQKQIKYQDTKLDLSLAKYTGKNNLFKAKNFTDAFKSFDIFRGKQIEDLTATDLFPGLINNFDNIEAVKKINLGKLFFGDTQTQIDFFRQVAQHLTNQEAFNGLNEIIDQLIQKRELQKAKDALVDPSSKLHKIQQAQGVFDKQLETRDKINKQLDEISEDRLKFDQSIEYDQKSTEQKLKIQRDKIKKYQSDIQKFENEKKALDKKWEDLQVYDENGDLYTQGIYDLLKRNDRMKEVFKQYKNIEKRYEPFIQEYINLYDEFKKNQQIIKNFETANMWGVGFHGKPQEVIDAEKWIENYKNRWDSITLDMAVDKDSALGTLILQETDKIDAAILDKQMTKLGEYERDLKILDNSKNVFKGVVKDMKDAITQTIKLQKQLSEEREAAIKALQDEFAQLEKLVAEEAKVTEQRKSFLTGMGNNVIAKFMQDNGQEYSLRRQQIERQIKEELGVTSLNQNQKRIAERLAYIEQLQNKQELEEKLNTFNYGVKTNELASKGGWSSSVYVSGKDNIAVQNLKTNQNQLEIQKQINKLLPELKKQMNNLNKNLQI